VLFVLALVVRLPAFGTIPPPTDETDELLVALRVYQGEILPLTTSEPYLSAVFVYLLAGMYALAGPSYTAGRTVALLCGALLPPFAWTLADRLYGPVAGWVAGLLLVFAFGPVVLGSHVAWSHGAAAAFVALSLAGMMAMRGGRFRRGFGLIAGLGAGLGLGAHPTVVTLLAGAGLWWLGQAVKGRRAWLADSAWMIAGAALGYAPVLAFVATEGLAPFRQRLSEHDYVGGESTTWPVGVSLWFESLGRNLWGPAQLEPFGVRGWLAIAALLVAVFAMTRRGSRLPALVLGCGAIGMPLLVDGAKFASLTGLRYAAPAIPLAAAAVGGVAALIWRTGGRRRRAGIVIAVAAVCLVEGVALARYYDATRIAGVTGEPVLAVVDGLAAGGREREQLFVDDEFDTKLMGGGEVGRAVRALLTLRAVEHTVAKPDKIRWFLLNGHGARYDLVLSGNTADELGAEFDLEPVRVVPVVPGQVSRSGAYWGWYRYRSSP